MIPTESFEEIEVIVIHPIETFMLGIAACSVAALLYVFSHDAMGISDSAIIYDSLGGAGVVGFGFVAASYLMRK